MNDLVWSSNMATCFAVMCNCLDVDFISTFLSYNTTNVSSRSSLRSPSIIWNLHKFMVKMRQHCCSFVWKEVIVTWQLPVDHTRLHPRLLRKHWKREPYFWKNCEKGDNDIAWSLHLYPNILAATQISSLLPDNLEGQISLMKYSRKLELRSYIYSVKCALGVWNLCFLVRV